MKFLIINSIDYNYKLYIEVNKVNKFFIQQSDIPIEFKDNIVYLLDYFLKKYNLSLNDLSFIGVITGPGSYTSLRVGLSMANALKLALNIPVIGINLFDILMFALTQNNTENFSNNVSLVVVSNNKGGYFAQLYNKEFENVDKPLDIEKNHILNYINLYGSMNIITNNLDIKYLITGLEPNITLYKLDITLETIKNSMLHKYHFNNFVKEDYPLTPLYIKPPKITHPKIRTH